MTKKRLYEIVFDADTRAGKNFDIALLIIIVFSIIVVMLESIHRFHVKYALLFSALEWFITILFTLEYFLRLYIVKRPLSYIFSFYGIVDFLSTIPTYLTLFISGASGFVVIRAIRLLRIFRILKLNRHVSESALITTALKASKAKILVFLYSVLMIVIIIGTIMYLIEGAENGFTNIPISIYWAIVTLTTVGYGDIAPKTEIGQFIASIVMVLGYAIIAVPTGIVTAEFIHPKNKNTNTQVCPGCSSKDHDNDAKHCKHCGTALNQ